MLWAVLMALVDFAISAFVTPLVVVDPLGLVPSFVSATQGFSEKDREMIALRAPVSASGNMVWLALFGSWILPSKLAIGLPAFQIAGGLLLFGVSYRMIFGDRPQRKLRETAKATGARLGRGRLSAHHSAHGCPGSARDYFAALRQRSLNRAAVRVDLVIVVVCAVSAVCFRAAELVARS
jgi:multiple antibiotic resistance protein